LEAKLKFKILEGKKLPAEEIALAKKMGADLVFSSKNDAVTIIYPTSDIAAETISRFTLREIDSEVYSPSYIIFTNINNAASFFRDRYGLKLDEIVQTKASQ
jgi:hypothetical protein